MVLGPNSGICSKPLTRGLVGHQLLQFGLQPSQIGLRMLQLIAQDPQAG